MADVDCIVPAAGRSERMGRWKPLLPFRGSTIVETVVDAALAACRRVILVVGHRGDELAARFAAEPRVALVRNPAWELGMFSSIQRGAAAVTTPRFFVQLADMPFVAADVYGVLLRAEGTDFVFPVHGGLRGHPVLLGTRVRGEILREDAATGSMKEIARRLDVRDVPVGTDSVLRDIDEPADLPDT